MRAPRPMAAVSTVAFSLFLLAGAMPSPAQDADASAAPRCVLAEGGEARQPIVVAEQASPDTRQAAEELAETLGRISGAPFKIITGDGRAGIAVGTVDDFPDLADDAAPQAWSASPLRLDDHLLRSHADGLYVIGAGESGVALGVWELLHRLGYRLFFLTDTWEIVPDRPELAIAIDAFRRSDFVTRDAPRGAPWSDRELWRRWRRRNGMTGSFRLDTGHSYGRIIRAKRAQFAEHPEYFALIDGERRTLSKVGNTRDLKFCISNPDLRRLVVEYAVETMRADSGRDTISLDPSDGANWCECERCAAMGSVSDRVVLLAGEVADATGGLGLGRKYVGIYAYNQHSPPPAVEVHPMMIVSIATSFIRGGYTLEELIEGWRARGATLGIRDYHDVFAWSHDLPRKARGGDVDYLCETIPYFHEQGARFMNSENADSWGANGLGYWLSPRLLWDVDAVQRVDELIDDFLQKAFGPAEEPMRAFYTLISRDDRIRSSEDLVARMYRRLDEAQQLTDNPRIRRRLDDLILYTRYVELYHAYRAARGDTRQAGFQRVWQHAYRMRDRMMLSTRAICREDRFRDKSVAVPEQARWDVPAEQNPWKDDTPFSQDEIGEILREGIAANEPTELDFELVEYGDELVPAARLNLPDVEPADAPNRYRGRQTVYTWLPETANDDGTSRRIELEVTGGLIEHYRDRGNVQFELFAAREATLDPVDTNAGVPPDGEPRRVVLTSPHAGVHRVQWTDGNDRTRVVWPDGLAQTFRSTLDEPFEPSGTWSLLFYVPRGTKTVGGFASTTHGRLLDGDGNERLDFGDLPQPDYFSVAVPEGQDGKPWRLERCTGSRLLMTVPPYLAPSPEKLLLPREVVEADAK